MIDTLRKIDTNNATTLLHKAAIDGHVPSARTLSVLVYDELRQQAARYLRRERRDHSLDPTALVHEAYVRLIEDARIDWRGRTHFLAICARAMRRILVDTSRKRGVRDGKAVRQTIYTLGFSNEPERMTEERVVQIHECLERLHTLHRRQAQVVERRFFSGMTHEEIATSLGVSVRTVKNDWRAAKAWLEVQLNE